ncbi:cystathionine gamma-synthase [Candidatus Acetothermia bacterium]|nr:cystathionine gamma-synthase [Candidatus Acetothermia bacterium]MBI3643209.1 cystathionine gamma-synthase [Candidatus Acetothermia bacterium]
MKARFETQAIHVGSEPDPLTGAVIPPIHLTSTYAQESPGVHKGYDYSRADNPTREKYEQALAALEGAKYATAFSSGVAATSAVATLLSPGDHVICSDDTYGGTYRLFEKVYKKYGIEFSYVDTSNLKNIKLKKNTKLIWVETPSNPLMKISDIKGIASKKEDALLVVDNTFSSPYLLQPHTFGADIVIHSATKYLGGHSDLIGGAATTNDKKLFEEFKFIQKAVGAVPSPLDCYLAHRGIKTLALRMKAHSENGQRVAEFLAEHPKITKVFYPGLPSHPGHEIAKKQMRAFSGMVSFEFNGNVKGLISNMKYFTLAESLGGIESLVNHPASMTHASIPPAELKRRGIGHNLVRLSVGVEHPDDLLDDLSSVLSKY